VAALLIPFALMGAGMGLVMSPMSTAAMNAVDVTKAGVASGILSMSRMVGGSFGVAAIGALFQSLSTNKFEELVKSSGLSAAKQSQLEDALGSGSAPKALKGLDHDQAAQVGRAMKESFVHALSGSLKLSTAVAVVGVVVAATLIAPVVRRQDAPEAAAEAVAEVA